PGEVKELIRCEGGIYMAYKANCIDFEAVNPGVKWMTKVGDWISTGAGSAWDSLRARIHHDIWHDGKNPECSEAAYEWGETLCSAEGVALIGACAANPGCWAFLTASAAGVGALWVAGSKGYSECTRRYSQAVIRNICIH